MDWLDFKEFIKDSFKYLLFILIVLVLIVYVVTVHQIVGPSMSPTLENGDITLLDKISYRFTDIKREDIISFYHEETKYLVKRVIGLPGENVEIKNNTIYIDGHEIEIDGKKEYISDDFSLSTLGYEEIPKDMYFVLGDNSENSLDSRDKSVGLIEKKQIIGKVFIRIWPITKFGLF